MIPQFIYIGLVLIALVSAGYKHNKPKEGKHNMYTDIITMAIMIGLLY